MFNRRFEIDSKTNRLKKIFIVLRNLQGTENSILNLDKPHDDDHNDDHDNDRSIHAD